MSTINEVWNKLIQLLNGEKVGRRMVQLWDFALKPENEHLVSSIMQVNNTIIQWEEKLLRRSQLEMVQDGSILNEFQQAMRDCLDEEWEELKTQISLQPLNPEDARRTLVDASGLVRNSGFESWVLGEIESPLGPETHETKVGLMRENKS